MPLGLEGKLFEALAKLGTSQGFELKGGGPGKPSQELVNQFLEAYNNAKPPEEGISVSVSDSNVNTRSDNIDMPKLDTIDNNSNVQSIKVTEINSAPEIEGKSSSRLNEVNTEQKPNPDNLMEELSNLIKEISSPGNSLSPNQLFRAQYIMGVLKTQSTTGMKISQSGSQGLESLLKQNG